MTAAPLICVRCNLPVKKNAESYEVFERMHWLCFHLEFEHQGDPDEPCGDPGCPWWHIEVLRRKLGELGSDPAAVIKAAIDERWRL
ncbi:hypothetical protein [Pelomonas sp. Root1237]|uniref:hypothetical protein n=1 Tax=Pelomonas sp. Root1237 TaxID=1736434 RepID=UPI0012F81D88|nr:hypothetical protein [Pelomonas sp. Root1237]